jgi:hypothetical protein
MELTKMSRSGKCLFCVAAVVSLASCGGTTHPSISQGTVPTADASGTRYDSVRALAIASDLVVLADVGSIIRSVRDNGGNPANTEGVPMVLLELRPARVLRGTVPGSKALTLAMIDQVSVSAKDWETPLRKGERVVLFLHKFEPADVPGLGVAEPVYAPMSGDNGIFSVSGTRLVSRSPMSMTLEPTATVDRSAKGSRVPLDIDIEELAQVAKT